MRLLITLTFLLALIPFQSHAHAWLTLKIATTDYAPYTSSDMQHNGYINHIIQDAFLEVGVEVEFVTLSWDEALEASLSGEYDAVSYGNFVRSREDEFFHSKPITAENLVFYVNDASGPKTWQELNDFSSFTMGVTKGYLYNDELSRYIKTQDNVETKDNDMANLQGLIEGDIDIFPIDELTGWYLLQREFSAQERENVMPIQPYLSTVTTHLLVPKDRNNSQLVLELFNKGLEELTLEGKLTRFKRLLKQGYYQHPQKKVNFDRR
ncbi:transporter substrate-binding domain-containing protein [Alteromonas sp. 345S023]|uniref:Transporter substrate-binding domain-containing protein n=1 Tax=Alteromonas profundi TaxID=2696062 RepID=A0A7X5RMZ2_9ALTE|nr:transporter substrate-binding domain-containing protein [Alteromonas profundi]NDV93030.1 transporter substrate-binding domain-containing protein [Alteromonas profundi]